MPRQILQSKSGIFGEKFNEGIRKKDFLPAKAIHRNKSNRFKPKSNCAVYVLNVFPSSRTTAPLSQF